MFLVTNSINIEVAIVQNILHRCQSLSQPAKGLDRLHHRLCLLGRREDKLAIGGSNLTFVTRLDGSYDLVGIGVQTKGLGMSLVCATKCLITAWSAKNNRNRSFATRRGKMPGVEGTESGLHGRLTAIVRATPHLMGPYLMALVLGGELPIKGGTSKLSYLTCF
jgi:hypothetical protein